MDTGDTELLVEGWHNENGVVGPTADSTTTLSESNHIHTLSGMDPIVFFADGVAKTYDVYNLDSAFSFTLPTGVHAPGGTTTQAGTNGGIIGNKLYIENGATGPLNGRAVFTGQTLSDLGIDVAAGWKSRVLSSHGNVRVSLIIYKDAYISQSPDLIINYTANNSSFFSTPLVSGVDVGTIYAGQKLKREYLLNWPMGSISYGSAGNLTTVWHLEPPTELVIKSSIPFTMQSSTVYGGDLVKDNFGTSSSTTNAPPEYRMSLDPSKVEVNNFSNNVVQFVADGAVRHGRNYLSAEVTYGSGVNNYWTSLGLVFDPSTNLDGQRSPVTITAASDNLSDADVTSRLPTGITDPTITGKLPVLYGQVRAGSVWNTEVGTNAQESITGFINNYYNPDSYSNSYVGYTWNWDTGSDLQVEFPRGEYGSSNDGSAYRLWLAIPYGTASGVYNNGSPFQSYSWRQYDSTSYPVTTISWSDAPNNIWDYAGYVTTNPGNGNIDIDDGNGGTITMPHYGWTNVTYRIFWTDVPYSYNYEGTAPGIRFATKMTFHI